MGDVTRGNPLEHHHRVARDWAVGVVAGLVSMAAVGVGRHLAHTHARAAWLTALATLVLVVAGVYAVRHLARAAGRTIGHRTSLGTGATVRLVVTGIGVVVLAFGLLGVLGVSIQRLLIGAGVTGVIVGIAAQQSLANVFAAVVLLFARPFVVGERIRIRSGVLGVLDVTVLGAGLTYVTVRTDDGILKVPNSVMLASGIGRPDAPPPPPGEPGA